MNKKERKRYLINRCYNAQYNNLPQFLKEDNFLKYVGLWVSILANLELYNPRTLTPECTDVLLNSGDYSASYENLEYTLSVFYELNYSMGKLRFIGDEPFDYPEIVKIIKAVLRMPKIRLIEVMTSGDVFPDDDLVEVLRNPGMTAVINSQGKRVDELVALFEEHGVNYDVREFSSECRYCSDSTSVFVEGKVFRCPKTAVDYTLGKEIDENRFVDIVARRLEIGDLRIALFDLTNSKPHENCGECSHELDF